MITVGDRQFTVFIDQTTIQTRVAALASELNRDYNGRQPLLVGVLNGSFMFAADLMKRLTIPCEISFVKFASYHRTASTGQVDELFGLNEDLAGRHVLVLEDIVDTGLTVRSLLAHLRAQNPASLAVATLLFKPDALQYPESQPQYVGFAIENRFVLGYGLDYGGLGRNLPDLHVVV